MITRILASGVRRGLTRAASLLTGALIAFTAKEVADLPDVVLLPMAPAEVRDATHRPIR